MVTTFFGRDSFGGDAAFVDRLSRALARHGHDVHVIHCRDAFNLLRGRQSPRHYEVPPGVTVHPLTSPAGPLSPLATHQTGHPVFKSQPIQRLIDAIRPDVVHFHNLSLIGGPGLLAIPAHGAVKLMTTHEHWLVCPLSVLWKFDREVCEQPACARCCLQAGRPPQWWRHTELMARSLAHLDALICPSRSAEREHARRGIRTTTTHLPYFLPHDYTGLPDAPTPTHSRPYVAAAGRLEKIKGFQDAIEAMRQLPELDLRIAGTGQFEDDLRQRAHDLPNVIFEGRLDAAQVAALFRGARAAVVPSLVFETFGYVVLEAFHERTPVVVRNLGALPDLVAESGGGLVFSNQEELAAALRRLTTDESLRRLLGERGYRARMGVWSEAEHLDGYFALIDRLRRRRRVRIDRGGPSASPKAPHAPRSLRRLAEVN
jgi:glycosyltransferase involved in cell wall biosynthesis